MVRKISGKSKSASYKHLNINFNNTEAKATSKKDIADTLGSTFMKNSSNRNYCEKIQTYKYDQQKINLNFKSSNTEEYNNPFNLVELKEVLINPMILLQVLTKCTIKCSNIYPLGPFKHF